MNTIKTSFKRDYNNVAISFDWSVEQATKMLKWIENDIFIRLINYKNKDFWLFHLFTIVISKILEKYWNNFKDDYSKYENELQKTFLLNDIELSIFKEIIFSTEDEVVKSTKNEVFSTLTQ